MKDHEYAFAKWTGIGLISVGAYWAKIPNQIQVLLLLMGIDLVTGLLIGLLAKKAESRLLWKGLAKKAATLGLLWMAHAIEEPLQIPFEVEKMFAYGFILYETMSIIENAAMLGVPIPSTVVEALAKAKIKTATPAEISRQFSMEETKGIIKTPADQPDISVTTKTTTEVVAEEIKPEV